MIAAMTHDEWLSVCGEMSRLWPRQPIPPGAAESWYPLLADLPSDQVREAVRTIALQPGNVWPPSLGQLREAAEMDRLRPWEDALAELRGLVHRIGSYRGPPPLEDPVLAEMVELYGWQALCAMDLTDATVRAQFRDTYTRAVERVEDRKRRQVSAQIESGPQLRAVDVGDSR